MSQDTMEVSEMEPEYDLSKLKSRKNPYAQRLKKQITIRISVTVIDWFKTLAAETGLPYQNLIDLYLEDCAREKRRPDLSWK